MDGAYCSWSGYGSNWSWGESRTGVESNTDRIYHLALDLHGSNNNVYAITNGTVKYSGYQTANGNYVVIEHTISNKTVYSFYAHLESCKVSSGQTVKCGDLIGIQGGTGTACPSPHLHFSIIDKANAGGYDGYGYKNEVDGNTAYHNNMTYYNPKYVIENGKLP